MKRVILNLLTPLLLVGCTGYQNSFDCPHPPGLGCQSMTQIHSHITENNTGADELHIKNAKSCECESCLTGEEPILLVSMKRNLVSDDGFSIQRVPERIAKIWLNGYVNKDGDYEGARYVYVALKDDTWRFMQQWREND